MEQHNLDNFQLNSFFVLFSCFSSALNLSSCLFVILIDPKVMNKWSKKTKWIKFQTYFYCMYKTYNNVENVKRIELLFLAIEYIIVIFKIKFSPNKLFSFFLVCQSHFEFRIFVCCWIILILFLSKCEEFSAKNKFKHKKKLQHNNSNNIL